MTLERYAAPDLTLETVAAIIDKHGLSAGPTSFVRLPEIGINNVIYGLGDDLILRVARNDAGIFESARKEAIAAPAARNAGVATPFLIAFDDTRDLLPTPFSIYERVVGETLGLLDIEPKKSPGTWTAIGRDLARLHSGVRMDGPAGQIAAEKSAWASPEELATQGYFSASESRWLTGWLERLEMESQPGASCFLHLDVQTTNIMVRSGSLEYLALLDWGSCAWGDPANDLASTPLRAIPFVLEGYREVAPELVDATLPARILRRSLQVALHLVRRQPAPHDHGQSVRWVNSLESFNSCQNPMEHRGRN
jgi:aminoglycoside phosphotransferase (APT) family kinase protein